MPGMAENRVCSPQDQIQAVVLRAHPHPGPLPHAGEGAQGGYRYIADSDPGNVTSALATDLPAST